MITRILVLLACSWQLVVSVDDLALVEGDHQSANVRRAGQVSRIESQFQRRKEAAARFNRRRPSSRASSDIIFAPLDGIITKEKMYINAFAQHDDKIYEEMLLSGKGVDTLDPFFVTPPPQRTTVATMVEAELEIVNAGHDNVSGGSINQGSTLTSTPPSRELRTVTAQPTRFITHERRTAPLRLVTLPRAYTTPLPPFKYAKKPQNDPAISFGTSLNAESGRTSQVRFPAQPWQIPPRDPSRAGAAWLSNLFEPYPLNPGMPPVNPFFPNMPNNQLQNTNLTNPFIPIGVSEPQPIPGLLIPNRPYPGFWGGQMVHKSPLRAGGINRIRELQPISLPQSGSFGDRDLMLPANRLPEPEPTVDFSIDGNAEHLKKSELLPYKGSAKTFTSDKNRSTSPEDGVDQLRQFAKQHPNILNSAERRPIYRGNQVVRPKSTVPQTTASPLVQPQPVYRPQPPPTLQPQTQQPMGSLPALPPPIMPASSGLNPNQKLDLCCRKQQVSPVCQSMCNFDSFNDKTLVAAFLTNQCPGPQLGKAYDCASSKADHSACCERAGLGNFQGGRCMAFCRTHQNTPANVIEYVACLQVFESIKGCYREHQLTHNNIFGD